MERKKKSNLHVNDELWVKVNSIWMQKCSNIHYFYLYDQFVI